jgi:hypothetical protein
MATRSIVTVATLAALVGVGLSTPAWAQDSKSTAWSPARLADGQPDIRGMWNNIDALSTPLQLPDGFSGPDFSPEDLEAIATARAEEAARRAAQPRAPSVGAYGAYWFDSFWNDAERTRAPALIVEPLNGQIPDWTVGAHEVLSNNRKHLGDSFEFMESADRCVTRGVIGIMMPGVYNNGARILQSPGYVVIVSEMIHRARIIPVDGRSHIDDKVRQWEGDPRGRWEGNTLIVESTNFQDVQSMRGASASIRSRQTEKQRLVERFTIVGPDTLEYSLQVDDPDTYTAAWTASFPLKRDRDYDMFEYACHEGNYSVPNSLSGARSEEGSR